MCLSQVIISDNDGRYRFTANKNIIYLQRYLGVKRQTACACQSVFAILKFGTGLAKSGYGVYSFPADESRMLNGHHCHKGENPILVFINRRPTQTFADFLSARPAQLKGTASRARDQKLTIIPFTGIHRIIKRIIPLGVGGYSRLYEP